MGSDGDLWIAAPSWLGQFLVAGLVGLFLLATVVHGLRPKYRRIYGWSTPYQAAKIALLSVPGWLYQLAVLVVLLLPMWWTAVLATGLLERSPWSSSLTPSPTAVLVFILATAHLVYWVSVLRAPGPNRRFEDRIQSDRTPAEPRRVAVIGAGMAGLVAAKELRAEGHDVVVFERSERWGGVWASSKRRGGRAWGSTITSTGSLNSTLSDCPFPIHHPENGETPLHFSRQQFLDMLVAYEQRYQVFDGVLRTGTEVEAMWRDGDDWVIRSRPIAGQVRSERFNAVTLCTGLNHEPLLPDLPGRGSFEGPELHVDGVDFTALSQWEGKRVLVVGLGETAADLAQDLVESGADHVFLGPRGSTVTLARNFGSVPPDYNENRVVYAGPMFNRWGLLLAGLPIQVTNLIKPARVPSPSFVNWLRIFRPHRTSGDFPTIMASANATKSDYLWRLLDAGQATLTETVMAVTADGVELAGGRELAVDGIIYCTGYRTRNAFLPLVDDPIGRAIEADQADRAETSESSENHLSARGLYKLTIPPDLPNVAVVGYARGMIGAITLSTELQARWWALIVSGKRVLPERSAMRREARRLQHRSRRFTQATRTTLTFASSLARNDIGCEPDMVDLFRHDRRLWWQLLNGPICAAHYRLHGVGAKPELAREQLTMPGSLHTDDWIDAVDVAYNLVPLAMILQPLWPALERVLPIPSTRRALDSYI